MCLLALGTLALSRNRAYYLDGQYLVDVRYFGQSHALRSFIQPSNPDVLAACSQFGPDPWTLFDFVCRNFDYKLDIGELWQFPSETLARGLGDCEDTSILLTSLMRAGGNRCYVALGSIGGYGHAWCQLNGNILETTYTQARLVPDPLDYCLHALFNEVELIELWPGALDDVFALGRDEISKLQLVAQALEGA